MAVSAEQVKAVLDPEEPDYHEAARLGVEALPHLQQLVETGDPALASKAACLAGFIGHPSAIPILELAASSPDASIRAGAASGVGSISSELAEPVLMRLIDDERAGIRKVALSAVPDSASEDLLGVVNARRSAESQPAVRGLAEAVFERISSRSSRPFDGLPGDNDLEPGEQDEGREQ